ncbi:hypothetical protein [Streptomyces yangpuensis]|uniref:hypothetical protein n=1 Tax=Streptomyces yangpuensis TaxID=1648182 RepID=UPI003723CBFE
MTITAQRPPLPAGVASISLESLHGFNVRKYAAGSPAVHLNALPAAVPGGWGHGRGGIDDDLKTEK